MLEALTKPVEGKQDVEQNLTFQFINADFDYVKLFLLDGDSAPSARAKAPDSFSKLSFTQKKPAPAFPDQERGGCCHCVSGPLLSAAAFSCFSFLAMMTL